MKDATMTEIEKLDKRIKKMYAQGMQNIIIEKGDGWNDLTIEERAKNINFVLDEIEAGQYDELPPFADSKMTKEERENNKQCVQ